VFFYHRQYFVLRQAILDFRFWIVDWGLGIKETGFFAVFAGCNEVSGQKTRFLSTRA
jgi:hypothetical protein